MIFFPTKDTLQHFSFTPAWRSSTYFLSNDFFPVFSPNGMNQNREKIQQNAFSETHVFKNKDCHVKKSDCHFSRDLKSEKR